MISFPYGIADFHAVRSEDLVYVDRTAHIRDLERLGRTLVFLRPRRFGKSLWLQALANYYDLRRADEFDRLFGGLAVGREPTALRNRYFVLQWNLSVVDPGGSVAEITRKLRDHVATQARVFAAHYRDDLPGPVTIEGDPESILANLLISVRQTPYRLYLLIDEYDNFVNEVMVRDRGLYHSLFETEGPYKQLFKSVKAATEGRGLERVFVTGVSPIALNDLTSGFNNAKDVSLEPDLATLCGFREGEIRDLLDRVAGERDLPSGALDDAFSTMRTWYNGYRFSHGPPARATSGEEDLVYNPTNALYFLEHLHRWGLPPEKLQDENLRTDRGKIAFLARTSAGAGVIEQLTEGDGTVEVDGLASSFSLEELLTRIGGDEELVASFLYSVGLLTLGAPNVRPRVLQVPNLVIRKLLLDRLLEIYLAEPADYRATRRAGRRFLDRGDLRALLAWVESRLLSILSNRDQGAPPRAPGGSGGGVNEMTLKALFLSFLFDDTRYAVFSELELDQGYADLCLLVRPEMRRHGFFDVLFEFKLVRRKELGKTGREIAGMDEAAVRRLPPVAEAFSAAREQLQHYRVALVERFGESVRPRCFAVVAVGLDRILGDEVLPADTES